MHRLGSFTKAACCGLLLLFVPLTTHAQFKASVQGTITDSSGALIPQAKVTVTNTETGKTQEIIASDDGFYRVTGLAPGKYKLTVEKTGYKQKVFDDVPVEAEGAQGLDVQLEAGDVSRSPFASVLLRMLL